MRLAKRLFSFMCSDIRGVAALGCSLAIVISINLVAKGLGWWFNDTLNATLLLLVSIAHTLLVATIGLIAIRRKTGSPRLRVGAIIGTVGYIHTLVGMVGTFGAASVVISESKQAGLTAEQKKDREDHAVQEIFAAIGASLVTSVIGWGVGKWIEAGAAEEQGLASAADEIKRDMQRIQGKHRELEASVQSILSTVGDYGKMLVATERKLVDGTTTISTAADRLFKSSSEAQEKFVDEMGRFTRTIGDMERSLPAWHERGQQMLDLQRRIIDMQSGMEEAMTGHGNALLGSTHAAAQLFEGTAKMLERLEGYLALIDDAMRRAASDAEALASITSSSGGGPRPDAALGHQESATHHGREPVALQ